MELKKLILIISLMLIKNSIVRKVLNLIKLKYLCTRIIVSPTPLCHSHESLIHFHLIIAGEQV